MVDTHKNRESNLNKILKIIIKAPEKKETKEEKQKRTTKITPPN